MNCDDNDKIEEGITGTFKFIIWHFIIHIIIFNLGRVTLFIITAGKYPHYYHLDDDHNKITLFGVVVIFIIWLAIVIYNNVNT